jgi:hypothetical protein
MGMDQFANDDDFNLKEEVAALFELWDDPDFAVKVGPEIGPNADALTSLTRGRGPRRGNLEDLLKYWRPIMKKPGGFRRCVVILMDKPQFGGRPQRICAWLHHEITGKWPNEGNHHGRGKGKGKRKRRGSRTRSVRRAGRRLKTVDILQSEIMFMPLDGSQEMVDFKVKRGSLIPNAITTPRSLGPVGTAATGAFSFALPGDLSDIRSPVRSAIFEALTPGLPSVGGRRGIGRRGGGARNKFRCPPGFQAGGTFTNSNFSTCGLRVLGIPMSGPGSFKDFEIIRSLADDADLRRSIGDLRTNRNSRAIIENSQIPAAPKEVSIGKRQSSIDLVVSLIDAEPNLDLGRRFVRRDGVILDIVLPNNTIAGLGEFDDMNDGVIVLNENLRKEGQIGQDLVPVMVTGLRAIVFHVPGQGTMSLRRVGGDMTDDERNGLAAAWAAALTSSQRRPDDPTAALRNFVENSDGRYVLDENISSGGAGEDAETEFNRELIVVESSAGAKITVPRWVYELYLSREAPRREEEDTIYSLVEDATKMDELSRFSVVKHDVVPDATFDCHGWSDAAERVAWFNQVKGLGGKAGRAIPDPSGKFRCPLGTGGGGQFTDSNGTTCGARLAASLIDSLYTVGRSLRVADHDIGRGSKRQKPVRTPKDGQVVDRLRAAGHDIDGVADMTAMTVDQMRESVNVARNAGLENETGLGATIGQGVPDRSVLSPEDAFMLQGDALIDALADVQDVVFNPAFADADQPLRLEVFGQLEDLASIEAARRGVAESSDRELGQQRLFDAMLSETLASVAPDSETGDSRTVGTAQSARQFAGSEILADMPNEVVPDKTVPYVGRPDKNIEMVPTSVLVDITPGNELRPSVDLDALAADLLENGFENPVVIEYDKNGRTVYIGEGNHRVAAAQLAGITEIPTVVSRRQSDRTGQGTPVRGYMEEGHVPGELKPSDVMDLPEKTEAAAPPVREFTAEELNLPEGVAAPPPRQLTPEQSAQRETDWAETLSALGIAEVDGVDIDKVAQSAEEWNAFNRSQEDSAARLAKVSEFLQERYPDKPWEQWTDKGLDLGRLSPEEMTDLAAKMWSMDVEFEGGIQKVRLADGTERDVRMTVTPRAGGSSSFMTDSFDETKPFEVDVDYDADGTVNISSLGHFERRYYDVETGELLGTQHTGAYDRSLSVNAETGKFVVYHEYMRNDAEIQFGEFEGSSPIGGGLAKELNYPAYAYYEALTGDALVEIGAAYSGRWIWPRQGAVSPIDDSPSKEAAFGRLTGIASNPIFSGGRAGPDGRSQKPSERLAAALIAPTPEHRSRYEALGDLRERGAVIDTRDVQLAIEAPVDGFDVDSGAMIDVSRNSMIDQSSFLEMSDGMIDVLRKSDANINGQSFSEYWDSMSPENQAQLAADIVKDLNKMFKDLGMGTSQTPITRLVDTGVR